MDQAALTKALVRLAALVLAVASARLFWQFGRAVEPQTSRVVAMVFAALFGVAAHMGLFLSAGACRRSVWFRRLTLLLMFPACVLLGAASIDAARRLIAGNPLKLPIALGYLLGVAIYAVQLVVVIRSLAGTRPAKAA